MKDDNEMKPELRLRFDTIYEVQIMSNKVGESITRIYFIVRLRLIKTQNLFTQIQLCRGMDGDFVWMAVNRPPLRLKMWGGLALRMTCSPIVICLKMGKNKCYVSR